VKKSHFILLLFLLLFSVNSIISQNYKKIQDLTILDSSAVNIDLDSQSMVIYQNCDLHLFHPKLGKMKDVSFDTTLNDNGDIWSNSETVLVYVKPVSYDRVHIHGSLSDYQVINFQNIEWSI